MNLVHRRRRREARCRGAASRSGAVVTSALAPWPPSRALRWLREACPRRRNTATAPGAPYTAFGPAAAACHYSWLTEGFSCSSSPSLVLGAGAGQPEERVLQGRRAGGQVSDRRVGEQPPLADHYGVLSYQRHLADQ